jgi:CheY-like chemotaxis protein
MKLIRSSAEHHFVTMLERLKDNPKGWVVLYFALSRALKHEDLVTSLDEMDAKIAKVRIASGHFADELDRLSQNISKGFIYLFSDNDVLLLAHPENEQEMALVSSVYKDMGKYGQSNHADRCMLGDDLYNYQKLADAKLLSAKCFDAYKVMGDTHKVSSIPVRRARRDVPKVMIVEDDRFTAAYAANILNKDYDLSICRTGEEGIAAYIEYAPDIVFLDIHLPGINGHDTLHAIKAVDPKAFVVMLSVDTAKASIVQATQTGAHSFLKKPFSKERLLDAVKSSPYVRGIHGD